jgi:hypothetical protein
MDMDLAHHNREPHIDDIKIKYHPKSAHELKFYHFDDDPGQQNRLTDDLETIDAKLWKLFHTHLDFEDVRITSEFCAINCTAIANSEGYCATG